MEFLQEFFVTAFVAVVFSVIVAISIAVAGSEEKNDGTKKEEKKKMVAEEVKLEKRLRVKGDKSKKRVKFADDVVVKNVDHFGLAEKPVKEFDLSEKLSEQVRFLNNLSEGVIVSEEKEDAKVIKVDDQFGGEGLVKESGVLLCSEELVKECDDVDMSRDVKSDYGEQKGCKDAGLLDKVFKREVVEQETEAAKANEFHGVAVRTELVSCLKALSVGDEMISEEIGSEVALELVKGDVGTDQRGSNEARDIKTSSSKLLGEALEEETIETNINRPEVSLDNSSVCGWLEDLVVDKKLKTEVLDCHNEVEMAHDDTAILQNEESEAIGVSASLAVKTKEEGLGEGNEVKEGLVIDNNIDDDDWEGVESSELEKVFAEAVDFVEHGGKGKDDQIANLGSDVQMQLYGLQRLALEGPCHVPQPMALKVSARAKWNAWQRLGSMSPEVAMEQYIKLLSDTDPGWMQHSSAGDGKREFIGSELTGSPETKKSSLDDIQDDTEHGRKLELEQETVADGVDLSSGEKSTKEISG